LEQKKLEARKLLKKTAESHKSTVRCVRLFLAKIDKHVTQHLRFWAGVRTTMIYTHVLQRGRLAVIAKHPRGESPLDN
jgi:hypothetical protein